MGIFSDLFPHSRKIEAVHPTFDISDIDQISRYIKDTLNIPKMFIRTPFPVIVKFHQDHIFRRGKGRLLIIRYVHSSASVEPVPIKLRVFREKEIHLQAGFGMDDVELESMLNGISCRIGVEIVLLFWKTFLHVLDMVLPDISNDIDVMSKSRFAVQDGCNGACYEIRDIPKIRSRR